MPPPLTQLLCFGQSDSCAPCPMIFRFRNSLLSRMVRFLLIGSGREVVCSVSVGRGDRLPYAWLDGTDKGHGVVGLMVEMFQTNG